MTPKFGDTFEWYDKKVSGQRLVIMVIGPDDILGVGRYRAMCLTDWAPGQVPGVVRSYPLVSRFGEMQVGWLVVGRG